MTEYSKTNKTLGLEKREATCGPAIWFSKHGGLEGMKPPTMIHTRLNREHFPQTESDFNLVFNEVNGTERVRDS